MKLRCLYYFLLALSGMAAAQPATEDRPDIFTARPRPSLYDLGVNGDLDLFLPLGKFSTAQGTQIDVRLECRTIDLGFGEAEGRFCLRPFLTTVGMRGGFFCWDSPSGDVYRFNLQRRRKSRLNRNEMAWLGAPEGTACIRMGLNGVSAACDSVGEWCIIQQAGAVLVYREGGLARLITKTGEDFAVEANGQFVHRMHDENGTDINIQWKDGLPVRFSPQEGVAILFQVDKGRLTGCTGQGIGRYSFGYNDDRLLEKVSARSGDHRLRWRRADEYQRGDISYALPFVLSGADELEYDYEVTSGMVILRAKVPGEPLRQLRFRTAGGALIPLVGPNP
jgi:hypothetical protein